jgi:hypothetical protein
MNPPVAFTHLKHLFLTMKPPLPTYEDADDINKDEISMPYLNKYRMFLRSTLGCKAYLFNQGYLVVMKNS